MPSDPRRAGARARTLAWRVEEEGPLDVESALALGFPLLGALALLHAQGGAHGAVAPWNVVGGDEGPAWLARTAGAGLGFAAPEQAPAGFASPSADLWAMAATLFFALSGRPPFGGAGSGGAPLPLDVARDPRAMGVVPVLERALARNPSLRPPDAVTMARWLLEAAVSAGLACPRDPDPAGLPDWSAWLQDLQVESHTATVDSSLLRGSGAALEPGAGPPAPAAGERLAGRFRLERVLGAGAMGTVFQAFDESTGCPVAVKTLHRLDPGSIRRIKHEFRSLCDVSHRNLVALHELFVDPAGRWFLTMELLRARTFLEYVREGGFDRGRLERALSQLARAVAHLHAQGKVHRDLKPANVLVEEDGRVVVVDFGLAAAIEEGRAAEGPPRAFAGTRSHAAPEQLEGRAVGRAADWYAVGVMLLEALDGPVASAPAALEEPDALRRLAARLLARDPALRADGADVCAALGEPLDPADDLALPFVGREREMATLRDAFARSRAGAVVIAVEGDSGIGKTALALRFLDELCGEGAALVLGGRCRVSEAIRYGALDAVIDELAKHLRRLTPPDRQRLLPDDSRALSLLFPHLRDLAPLELAVGPHDRLDQRARHRAVRALRELLGRVAQSTPLVVFVDDLHWSDSDSADLLHDVLAAPRPPLLFVGTVRPGARVPPALRHLLESAGTERLVLGPVAAPAIEHLARRCLDGAVHPVSPAAIAASAGGQPMLAVELALQARRGGGFDACTSVRAAVLARVRGLSGDARAALEVVCAAGRPVPRALVLRAASSQGTARLEALRELRLARTTRESARDGVVTIEAYHDQVAEAVRSAMDEPRRRSVHAAIASEAAALGGPMLDLAVDAYVVAQRPGDAAALAERAAEHATRSLAFHRAVELLELAAEHASEADLARRRAALGDARVRAGRTSAAAEAYEDAAAAAGEGSGEAFELRRRAMVQHFLAGHAERGQALLRQLGGAVGMPVARGGRPSLRLLLSFLRASLLGPPALRSPQEVRALPPEELARLRAQLRLVWPAAASLIHTEGDMAARYVGLALRLAAALGDAKVSAQAAAICLCVTPSLFGRSLPSVDRAMDRALDCVARDGDRSDVAFVRAVRGARDLYVGRLASAVAECLETATTADAGTEVGAAAQSLARAAVLPTLYWLGEVARAADLAEAWIADARETGNVHLEVSFRLVGAHRHLRRGDPGRALRELREVRAVDLDYAHSGLGDAWWEASALLYQGDAAAAVAACDRARPLFEVRSGAFAGSRVLWTLSEGTSWAALASSGHQPLALERLQEHARTAARSWSPLGRPVAAQLHGTLAGLQGDRARAARLLGRAIDGYDRLGMRLHAASLRLLAPGVGEREARRARALAVFDREGIVEPERWAGMMAPGVNR